VAVLNSKDFPIGTLARYTDKKMKRIFLINIFSLVGGKIKKKKYLALLPF